MFRIGGNQLSGRVQDMMMVKWPALGFTYDASSFWVSTLCHAAPSYPGLIQGISGTGIGITPPDSSDKLIHLKNCLMPVLVPQRLYASRFSRRVLRLRRADLALAYVLAPLAEGLLTLDTGLGFRSWVTFRSRPALALSVFKTHSDKLRSFFNLFNVVRINPRLAPKPGPLQCFVCGPSGHLNSQAFRYAVLPSRSSLARG